MAPIQKINQQNNQRRILRSTNSRQNKTEGKNDQKRNAECSPPKNQNHKRSAFVDITNVAGKKVSVVQNAKNVAKKVTVPKPVPKPKLREVKAVPAALEWKNDRPPIRQPVQKTQATIKRLPTTKKSEVVVPASVADFDKENLRDPAHVSLYGHIQLPQGERNRANKSPVKKDAEEIQVEVTQQEITRKDSGSTSIGASLFVSTLKEISIATPETKEVEEKTEVKSIEPIIPASVADFDKENLHDPAHVSLYAMDIFNYLKAREAVFKVSDYMDNQPSLSKWMRSLLVDWMVEVQENLELNHESLYLAVKLVDLYLSKIMVTKQKLQLLGATALFLASKYDEHCPPVVKDVLYLCDGFYKRDELFKMEISLMKAVDFNLGMPLSYTFLRRYARCARLELPMLTLARYILERSLMEYTFIQASESKLAAAALFLALKMKLATGWTETLVHYSGYSVGDIMDLASELNKMLHRNTTGILTAIRDKYMHEIYFEVAKTPLVEVLTV